MPPKPKPRLPGITKTWVGNDKTPCASDAYLPPEIGRAVICSDHRRHLAVSEEVYYLLLLIVLEKLHQYSHALGVAELPV